MSETSQNKNYKIPLNQIFYGPPGTGKTYNVVEAALEILKEYREIKEIPENRKEKKKIFDDFKNNKEGQIEFITFHQSYSYEEFVEGIRPKLDDENNNDISYTVEKGIFKKIAEKARKNYDNSKKNKEELATNLAIEDLLNAYGNDLQERLDEENKIELTTFLGKHIKVENVVTKNGEISSIEISIPSSNRSIFLTQEEIINYYDKFKQGEIERPIDIRKIENPNKRIHYPSYYFALFEDLKRFEEEKYSKSKSKSNNNQEKIDNKLKPYILIIDEINRGNISKIFGELITLLEPSKRIGDEEDDEEELIITLPYSNEKFGVPKNLYIIGTMNTADRSIALLDTALRRRFDFIEMMPKPDLLKECKCGDVELDKLLTAINYRIELLLDREHTIGHSYFIGINKIEDLSYVFKNKVIPLLQEYFYDDYGKIIYVLNDNKMIEAKEIKNEYKNDDYIDSDKKIYQFTDYKEWNAETFRKIYDKKDKNKEENNQ